MSSKKLVVIGGGAAGFFCAINAAKLNPALEVVLLEKTSKLLAKVKVSGGGRCNTTHACFDITEMSTRYPRGGNFVKKTFHQFFTTDTIKWFKERGVELKEEPDGRMFPVTNSSQTIIDCLMREINARGIQLIMNTAVQGLKKVEDKWVIETSRPQTGSPDNNITADYVCIASGGYPKLSMFDWLKGLDHTIEEPVPSLFTFNIPGDAITELMGISVENARVKIAGTKLEEEGPLLITHWGMSGPAILKLSAWGARDLHAMEYRFNILVNWLPDYNISSMTGKFQSLRFEVAGQKIANRNHFGLPQRLWEYLVEKAGINNEKRWADLAVKEQHKLIQLLCAGEFSVKDKTTFKEEFVTAGGVKLTEVDPSTMMSRRNEHLFFAGEILDVDGITGGYNFQHAWTSGFIAGKHIATIAGQS